MKKRFRKTIAILLAVIMMILFIPFGTLSANASSVTSDQAIAWCQSKLGQGVEYSIDEYRYQCVDFIQAYYAYLGVTPSWGSGYQYAENTLPAGWTRTYGGQPQKGDILVYTGGYGHVAIYESDYVSYHQNWGGSYVQRVERYYANSVWVGAEGVTKYYWGCIHPNFATNGGGGPVDLGTDFYAFIFNTDKWKPLTVEQDLNVTIRTEKSYMCADQIFKFERQSDRSYKIISTANGMCLDVKDASSASLANVKICESNNTDAQRWYIYGSSGQYTLKAKCTNCVLDVMDNGSADGTNIQMCTSNNSEAQKFQIYKEPTRPFAANLGDGFTVPILNKRSWITLENYNSNIILNKEVGKSKQLWKFIRQTDGSYKIYSCLDGKCIDLENASHEKGTNIGLCEENKENAQRWYIYYINDEYYFQSKESGMMFDITDNNLNFGSNLQACNWNGCDAQIFAIYWGKECKLSSPELEVVAGNTNSKTKFAWTEVYGETGYTIRIWKDQIENTDAFVSFDSSNTEYEIKLPNGIYQAVVEAYNIFDTKRSNVVTFNVEKKIVIGDVNGDNNVDVLDAAEIQKYSSGMADLTAEELSAADVNGDNNVDVLDAAEIQKFAAGIITEFKKKRSI